MLVRCREHNSAANTNSLHKTQFQQRTLIPYRQHKFSAANTLFSAANKCSLHLTQFWQRPLGRCKEHNFGSEHWFAACNTISAAKADSLQRTQFQQRTLVRYTQHNFGSECCSLQTTQFGSELWFPVDNIIFGCEHLFAAENTISAVKTDSLQATPCDTETWFAADTTIRQRKLIRCRPHNSTVKLIHCRQHNLFFGSSRIIQF